MSNLTLPERIDSRALLIRGLKVMLDKDVAELYEVKTTVLNQTVKRNIIRFPEDSMFQLTKKEVEDLISRHVLSSKTYDGNHFPYVFTELGIFILSGVLNSKMAVSVNIAIIRALTRFKGISSVNQPELKVQSVFEIINELVETPKNIDNF